MATLRMLAAAAAQAATMCATYFEPADVDFQPGTMEPIPQ